jgi:FMN reductase
MKISVVVGNPNPTSRTLHIATGLADRLAAQLRADQLDTFDLAQFASGMFTWPNDELTDVLERVSASDLVIVASPVYKGTFTGLLKAFFDRYDTDGLAGVTAIPVMSVGSPLHGLAAEVGLRPLLVELGASVPTRSLVFLMAQFSDLDSVLDDWVSRNVVVNKGLLGALPRDTEELS